MSNTPLVENTMYKDAAGRAAIVANPALCAELFVINFLGWLGLYSMSDSRGPMKAYATTEGKVRLNEIGDDNHDVTNVLKLCVDAGVFTEAKVAPITRFMALIKQRSVRSKDVDDQKIRDMVDQTMIATKTMSPLVKTPLKEWLDAKIDLKELSRQVYELSKKNTWRDYTLELRNIVLRGTYTDFFSAMKKAAAGGAALPPAAKPSSPQGPASAVSQGAAGGSVTPPPSAASTQQKNIDDLKNFIANEFKLLASNPGSIVPRVRREIGNNPLYSKLPTEKIVEAIETVKIDTALDPIYFELTSISSTLGAPRDSKVTSALLIRMVEKGAYNFKVYEEVSRENDAALEKYIEKTVKEWPLPTNEDELYKFELIGTTYRRMVGPQGFDEARRRLEPLIKPLDANHNMHIAMLIGEKSGIYYTKIKFLDPSQLGSKARAWINKLGTKAKYLTQLSITQTITGQMFQAMSPMQRVEWVCANWSTAGEKLNNWLKKAYGTGITKDISKIDEGTLRKIQAIIPDSHYGINELNRVAGAGYEYTAVNYMMGILRAVAMDDVLNGKKIDFPAKFGEMVGSLEGPPWLEKKFASKVANMPYSTASEIQDLASTITAFTSPRISRNVVGVYLKDSGFKVDLTNSDVSKSGIAFLGILMDPRMVSEDKPWVSWNIGKSIVIKRDRVSLEVMAWIEKHGQSLPVVLTLARQISDIREISFEILKSFNQRGNQNFTASDEDVKKALSQDADIWKGIIAEFAKTPDWKNFEHTAYDRSFQVGDKTYEIRIDAAEVIKGLKMYVTSSLTLAEIEKPSNNVDYSELFELAYIDLPVTDDALAVANFWAKGQSLMSFQGNADPNVSLSIVKDVIDNGGISRFKNNTTILKLLVRWLSLDFSAYGQIMDAIPVTDPWERGLYTGMFVQHKKSWNTKRLEKYKQASYVETELVKRIAADASNRSGYYDGVFTEIYSFWTRVKNKEPNTPPPPDDYMNGYGIAYDKSHIGKDEEVCTIPWIDDIVEYIKPDKISETDLISVVDGMGDDASIKEAAKKLWLNRGEYLGENATHRSNINGFCAAGEKLGATDDEIGAAVAKMMTSIVAKAKPTDIAAQIYEMATGNSSKHLNSESLSIVLPRLLSSESAAIQEAVASIAFDSSKKGLKPSFIEAVKKSGKTKTILNRLNKEVATGGALQHINEDPAGVPIQLDPGRLKMFLKFNNIDLDTLKYEPAKTLEELGNKQSVFKTAIPSLPMEEILDKKELLERTSYLATNNRYNHDPKLGMEVKRAFKYVKPDMKDRFDEWVKANPDTKVVTLFHGTGTIAASFILRFGFKIIPSTDGSVTGRMLGDGIYFADNLNKSMLYMSNFGYVQRGGQEGYVFKCKVALGKYPKNHQEGWAHHNKKLVSNEWAVYSTDQIVIEEVYYGYSRTPDELKSILNEGFEYFSPTSSFVFMDGQIPIDEKAEIFVDFEKFPDFGDHVWIEPSALGPVVVIRHDTTFEPQVHTFRWGEEIGWSVNSNVLKDFFKLLKNRY